LQFKSTLSKERLKSKKQYSILFQNGQSVKKIIIIGVEQLFLRIAFVLSSSLKSKLKFQTS